MGVKQTLKNVVSLSFIRLVLLTTFFFFCTMWQVRYFCADPHITDGDRESTTVAQIVRALWTKEDLGLISGLVDIFPS